MRLFRQASRLRKAAEITNQNASYFGNPPRFILFGARSSQRKRERVAAEGVWRIVSGHLGLQSDRLAIDDEFAEAPMVNSLGILLSWVNPGFHHLQNE